MLNKLYPGWRQPSFPSVIRLAAGSVALSEGENVLPVLLSGFYISDFIQIKLDKTRLIHWTHLGNAALAAVFHHDTLDVVIMYIIHIQLWPPPHPIKSQTWEIIVLSTSLYLKLRTHHFKNTDFSCEQMFINVKKNVHSNFNPPTLHVAYIHGCINPQLSARERLRIFPQHAKLCL